MKSQNRLPHLVLSQESLDHYSLIKLVNLINRRKTNAMGLLQCKTVATAFLIWKQKSKIELTAAYDGQAKLIGLYRVALILKR